MANVAFSGSIYIDTAGEATPNKAKVSYILYTSNAANDTIVIRDGTSGTDPIKFTIKNPTANSTIYLDFSVKPVTFNNGIYVSSLSASSVATLVLTSAGE